MWASMPASNSSENNLIFSLALVEGFCVGNSACNACKKNYMEISTFSFIEFWKIVEFYGIIMLFKANQIAISDYQ